MACLVSSCVWTLLGAARPSAAATRLALAERPLDRRKVTGVGMRRRHRAASPLLSLHLNVCADPCSGDPRFPYPHLHAHAFLGPFDKNLPGSTLWRRNVVYGTLNWWSVEDLRAEIREETSNNRVKSGYEDRIDSPIDHVPDAGAVDVSQK